MEPSDTDPRRALDRAIERALERRGLAVNGGSDIVEAGYGKWWARVRGKEVMLALVIAGGLAAVGGSISYLLMEHDRKMDSGQAEVRKLQSDANALTQALVWVTWACNKEHRDPECDQINLARPSKIREMQAPR